MKEVLEKEPIVEQCIGCDNIEDDKCRMWMSPAAKWRTGVCPTATHVKLDAKSEQQAKVRVGQQKQKKARTKGK